jgi:hypothetical protein
VRRNAASSANGSVIEAIFELHRVVAFQLIVAVIPEHTVVDVAVVVRKLDIAVVASSKLFDTIVVIAHLLIQYRLCQQMSCIITSTDQILNMENVL